MKRISNIKTGRKTVFIFRSQRDDTMNTGDPTSTTITAVTTVTTHLFLNEDRFDAKSVGNN
ncbi:hypothetical protein ASE74_24200 [Pedobacter sp. Leaf216]|uniref:hypothetical protein n=1 Tax=Pedobacter sp. Leaf216 TaxID=1735684 RepID=UPI0006F2B171|nr:hypothetical protein [Pedobacter sp. Leaf216]KQM68207.1 hypothetical protein ASE74_24200 [Pedobacter sp. Leaf216]